MGVDTPLNMGVNAPLDRGKAALRALERTDTHLSCAAVDPLLHPPHAPLDNIAKVNVVDIIVGLGGGAHGAVFQLVLAVAGKVDQYWK